MVIRQSAALVAVGIGIGLALATFAVRPRACSWCPGVRPTDAVNFLIAGAVLSGAAMTATLAPSWRALRVDPMVALRHE